MLLFAGWKDTTIMFPCKAADARLAMLVALSALFFTGHEGQVMNVLGFILQ